MTTEKGKNPPPAYCCMHIIQKCVLKCKMCIIWSEFHPPKTLTSEDCYKIMDDIGKLTTRCKVDLIGGEPFLEKDIFKLTEHASGKGFLTNIITSGCTLNEDTISRIVDSGLSNLGISLDSLDENTHDCLRGTKGIYSRIMKALKTFASIPHPDTTVSINTIIMNANMDHILDLVHWAQKNPEISSMHFQAISSPGGNPFDRNWFKNEKYCYLWPKDERKIKNLIDTLIELKSKGYRISNPFRQLENFKSYFTDPLKNIRQGKCTAGDTNINIDPWGNVYLCSSGPIEPVGNIRNTAIMDLWESDKAQEIREKIYNCQLNCLYATSCEQKA